MIRTVISFLVLSFVIIVLGKRCPCEDNEFETVEPLSRSLSNVLELQACFLSTGTAIISHIKALKLDFNVYEVADQNAVDYQQCNVIIRLDTILPSMTQANIPESSNLCPGKCFPIPELTLPIAWFTGISTQQSISISRLYNSLGNRRDYAITCSLEARQLVQLASAPPSSPHSSTISLRSILSIVLWRRIMECREQKYWRAAYEHHQTLLLRRTDSTNLTAIYPFRRKVESVVIWIGAVGSLPLIKIQARMLHGQDIAGSKAVVGWAATDDLYACRENTTWCAGGNKGNARYKYLPNSAMNWMKEGWRCAQRRPLRALAHTLLLYDPHFLILVDDDTFVNYPLLAARYSTFIYGNMTQQPMVMGELLGKLGPQGHLSKGGIFAGGSGYILSRKLLKNLVAKEVTYFGGQGMGWVGEAGGRERHLLDYSDSYRSHEQVKYLNILGEGFENSKTACAGGVGVDGTGSCILSLEPILRGQSQPRRGRAQKLKQVESVAQKAANAKKHLNSRLDLVLPLAVRLIDFCANLMAGEHTCQHSDHSVGRCLVYAAFAAPINVVCNSTVPLAEIPNDARYAPAVPLEVGAKNVMVGMCFMAPFCDTRLHTTCHRYKPSSSAEALAIPSKISSLSRMLEESSGAALGAYLAGTPERINTKNAYYRVFSSVWDGKLADSYG